MNHKQAAILALLAREDTPKGMDSLEIADKARVNAGMVYTYVKELEDYRLVEGRWQTEDRWPLTGRPAPAEEPESDRAGMILGGGRSPRNRYYRITPDGHKARSGHAVSRPGRRGLFSLKPKPQTG